MQPECSRRTSLLHYFLSELVIAQDCRALRKDQDRAVILYSRSPDQIVEYANPVSRRSQQQPSHLQPQRSQLPSQGAERSFIRGEQLDWESRQGPAGVPGGERGADAHLSALRPRSSVHGELSTIARPPHQDCQNLLVTHHSTNSYAVPTVCQHCSRAWDGSLNKTNEHISPPRSSF